MESLIKIFHDWEIQLLVLLSFTIQIFLFFTGGLRRRSTNMLLKLSIWIAYLGADLVAVYALGYLSRHEDATTGSDTLRETHPLVFLWAPFLLIHLGGQDTITAFAMEDNNLWLRHLLNLVVQVILAIYVFWKSIGRHNVELLVSGIFMFVAGIIKYWERTWSLKCGSFENLEDSPGNQYEHRLPEDSPGNQYEHRLPVTSYYNTVCMGLRSMPTVLRIFVARIFDEDSHSLRSHENPDLKRLVKLLEIELGIMYNDLYTKALLLRTRSGIILRFVSQMCAVVAFIVFLAIDQQSYSRVDMAITYSLFVGGFILEVCAVIIFMASPWTWTWLKARTYDKLAWFSWLLFSNDFIGWSEKGSLWSNAMGQYNFIDWLHGSKKHQPRSCNQHSMIVVRTLATSFGVEKKKIFWMSKILDTEYVKVNGILECLLEGVDRLSSPKVLPKVGSCFRSPIFVHGGFGFAITTMHLLTELYLTEYSHSSVAAGSSVLMEDCRKLSRYMMYLLVSFPSLLPLESSSVATLESWQQDLDGNLRKTLETLLSNLQVVEGTLQEIKEVWIRLIIYTASKPTRPEMHAAQLARGGELLSFVWLQLGHYGRGSNDMLSMARLNPFTLYAR